MSWVVRNMGKEKKKSVERHRLLAWRWGRSKHSGLVNSRIGDAGQKKLILL